MKIIRALSLVLCVVLLLFGCGANNTQTDDITDKQAELAQKTEPVKRITTRGSLTPQKLLDLIK